MLDSYDGRIRELATEAGLAMISTRQFRSCLDEVISEYGHPVDPVRWLAISSQTSRG